MRRSKLCRSSPPTQRLTRDLVRLDGEAALEHNHLRAMTAESAVSNGMYCVSLARGFHGVSGGKLCPQIRIKSRQLLRLGDGLVRRRGARRGAYLHAQGDRTEGSRMLHTALSMRVSTQCIATQDLAVTGGCRTLCCFLFTSGSDDDVLLAS